MGAPISMAGGPFPVDMARAQADARNTLNSIDWSKSDIVIWVPGTDNHNVAPAFEDAVRASWSTGGVSLTKLDYEASWDMRPSVATGIATMKLVLAGIAAHGGNHRIMLAGESQGAWVIGEALADPMLRKVVDRAMLLGHPGLAAHHYDGTDPDIREYNHEGDLVAMPVHGDAGKALDAMTAIHQLQLWKFGTMAEAVLANPQQGVALLRTVLAGLPGIKNYIKDAHDYSGDMTRVVEFLRFGRVSDGADYGVLAPLSDRRRRATLALAASAMGA
jgi:hypothetical protein